MIDDVGECGEPCYKRSMDHNTSPLERAFQLAKSGEMESISDLKKRLKSEGYSIAQIEGRTINKQLATLIRNAKGQADTP